MSNWDRILRGTQSIKAGSVLSTMESRDFLSKAKKLVELDDICQILYKDARQLGDRESEAFKAEKKMVADLCASLPIREDTSLRSGLQEWAEHIKHQEEYMATMISNTSKVLVEPVKRLLLEFPKIQASIKRRDQLLMEYDKCQQKVDKLRKKERTGANIVKTNTSEKSLAVAKQEFEAENQEVLAQMSNLYEQRAQYMTPSVHALINLQISHLGEGFKGYTELQESMKPIKPPVGDKSDKFSEFRTLSIVSSDDVQLQ